MFIRVISINFCLNEQLLVWNESLLGSSGFNELLWTSGNTHIHSLHTQYLECSVLVCRSQLALVINDQAFCLLGHLMTIGKILACVPVEWSVELIRSILFEIRSRSLSAFGTWVKCNLLVWVYSGSFLVSVDWQQEFMFWWVYGPTALGKTLVCQSSKYD